MKILFVCGAALLLGGGMYLHNPFGAPNEYALPAEAAYAKLSAVRIEPSGTGPFFRLVTTSTGNGKDRVTWSASGSHAAHTCVLSLVPAESAKTRIDVSCQGGGAGDGAARGLGVNRTRNRVIEQVDAALRDRPFNPRLAGGSTASGWPDDVIHHAGFNEAVSESHKMNAEMQRAVNEPPVGTPATGEPGGWGASTPGAR